MKKIIYLLCCYLCTIQIMAQEVLKSVEIDKQISQIDFTETFENGTSGAGTLSYQSLDNETIMANYSFEKTSLPNPFSVKYNYQIKKEKDGGYSIDLGSVLDPLSMRIDDNVEVEYLGDALNFPAALEVGTPLKDAQGEYMLKISKARFGLICKVSVTNRQVVGQETIEIDGENYDTFIITYEYKIGKSVDGQTISMRSENIKEWYVPGIGAIAKTRFGKSKNKEQIININSTLTTNSVSF